jgi:AcrR family transcriptional regulator
VPRKRPVSEYLEGTKRRAAITRAAARLFALNGYRDASLASIASEADLTQQGLLHHFPSKPDLLRAVLRDRERRDKKLVADMIEQSPDDVVRVLKMLLAHHASERSDALLHIVVSAEATSASHPAHEFFVARNIRVRNALSRSIRKQAAGSGISDAEINALAAISIAVMDGLQLQWLLDPEVDMAANFEVFGSLLQQAIQGVTHDRACADPHQAGQEAADFPDDPQEI